MRIPSLIWKPGVTSYGPAALAKVAREKKHEGSWQFSYRILEPLLREFDEKDEDILERLFCSMEAGPGVYKITKRRRFDRLDQRIIEEAGKLRKDRRYLMHDAACSSGVTSLDLWRGLRDVGDWRLTASDFFTHLWLVDIGRWTVALDQQGEPKQITGLNMVLSCTGRISFLLPVNRLMRMYANRSIVPRAVARWRKHCAAGGLDSAVRKIPLFHPAAAEESKLGKGFDLRQQNIFEPLASKVDILRVMNFLTPNHLTRERILSALEAVQQSLTPNGLLIVGRTRDESDGALLVTAYRKVGEGRLSKQWEMDGPWECEHLMTKFIAASPA